MWVLIPSTFLVSLQMSCSLFQLSVRPMLILAALSTPLFLSATYAFAEPFFSEPGIEPTWGETVGRVYQLLSCEVSIEYFCHAMFE